MASSFEQKQSQTLNDSCGINLSYSKNKPTLNESRDGKEIVSKTITEFFKKESLRRDSRHTSKGAIFAERFKGIVRDVFKKPVSQKSIAN